jgi:hypothetical protein
MRATFTIRLLVVVSIIALLIGILPAIGKAGPGEADHVAGNLRQLAAAPVYASN